MYKGRTSGGRMYMYRTCAMHVHKYTKHKHANINMNTYTNSYVHGIIKIYAGKKKDTAAHEHEHEHVLHARSGRMRTSMRSNSTQDTRSTMWNASAQNTWSCTTQTKRSRSRSSNNNNNNNNNHIIFRRGLTTLKEALSVGPLVYWSVHKSNDQI